MKKEIIAVTEEERKLILDFMDDWSGTTDMFDWNKIMPVAKKITAINIPNTGKYVTAMTHIFTALRTFDIESLVSWCIKFIKHHQSNPLIKEGFNPTLKIK